MIRYTFQRGSTILLGLDIAEGEVAPDTPITGHLRHVSLDLSAEFEMLWRDADGDGPAGWTMILQPEDYQALKPGFYRAGAVLQMPGQVVQPEPVDVHLKDSPASPVIVSGGVLPRPAPVAPASGEAGTVVLRWRGPVAGMAGPVAAVIGPRGPSAFEEWQALPGNEGKTFEEYQQAQAAAIVEAAALPIGQAVEAAEAAVSARDAAVMAANGFDIGTVETGEEASATITGAAPERRLNLVIPQGLPGLGTLGAHSTFDLSVMEDVGLGSLAFATDYEFDDGSVGGLVFFDGQQWREQSTRKPISFLANPAALTHIRQLLASAGTEDVLINCYGDSLTFGEGAEGGQNPDDTGDRFGYVGRLRSRLTDRLGVKGGGWMSSLDARAAYSGTPVLLNGFGIPYNTGHQGQLRLKGAGDKVTFTVPACTAIDIMDWQDTAASYSGSFKWSIDGGAETIVAGVGGSSAYRTTRITGLIDQAHTITIEWVSGNVAISGVRWHHGAGLSVLRIGVGGATSNTMLRAAGTEVQKDRVRRALFNVFQPDLAIIMLGHNDASQQGAQGTTPDVYGAHLQTMIDTINLNSKPSSILLISQPDSSSVTEPYGRRDYWPVARALAGGSNPNVAHVRIFDFWGDYAAGNAAGYYSDWIHYTNLGADNIAGIIEGMLT